MKAIIRISGQVNIPKIIEETLFRLRLRRKYTTIIIKECPEIKKLLLRIRNYVAYGDINNETLKLLIQKRAVSKDKKRIDAESVMEKLEKGLETDIKPFFRLHPPRGGIDAKKHFPTTKKAVLGDNKDKINELIRRMLWD